MSGRWDDPKVPKSGWTCEIVEDMGGPGGARPICEMCQTQALRYVHTMSHPEWPETLEVGCDCAGRMEGDEEGAKTRERKLKNRAARAETWAKRQWRTSEKGSHWRRDSKESPYNFTIFADKQRPGLWRWCISNGDAQEFSRGSFTTVYAAKYDLFFAWQRWQEAWLSGKYPPPRPPLRIGPRPVPRDPEADHWFRKLADMSG